MKRAVLSFCIMIFLVSGNLFGQEQNFYLGTGNGTEPQGYSCSSCHQSGNIGSPKFDTYKNTLHAQAYDSIAASTPGWGFNCVSCHTTGWDVTQLQFGAD